MDIQKLKIELQALSKCIESVMNLLDEKPTSYVIVTQKGVNIPNQPIVSTLYYVDYGVWGGFQITRKIEQATKFDSIESANAKIDWLKSSIQSNDSYTVEPVY